MTKNASHFIGDIPRYYDEGLGPVIFADYAEMLARRAAGHQPARVLELAAGTGIASRLLRNYLPVTAELVVTDLNPPMLEVARAKFDPAEKVAFAQADALQLDYPDASFDQVVCQFGVMFFPDKVRSFGEVARVLRPGGRYVFNSWGSLAENPFAQLVQDVSDEMFPTDPPGFYRVPFSYADPARTVADLEAGGLRNVTAEIIPIDKAVASWAVFARGIVFGNPIIDEIVERGQTGPEQVATAVEARFRNAFGPEPGPMPLKATVFTAEAE